MSSRLTNTNRENIQVNRTYSLLCDPLHDQLQLHNYIFGMTHGELITPPFSLQLPMSQITNMKLLHVVLTTLIESRPPKAMVTTLLSAFCEPVFGHSDFLLPQEVLTVPKRSPLLGQASSIVDL